MWNAICVKNNSPYFATTSKCEQGEGMYVYLKQGLDKIFHFISNVKRDDICVRDYYYIVDILIWLGCQLCHSLGYMFEILIEGDGLGGHVAIYWRGLPEGEVSDSSLFLSIA